MLTHKTKNFVGLALKAYPRAAYYFKVDDDIWLSAHRLPVILNDWQESSAGKKCLPGKKYLGIKQES